MAAERLSMRTIKEILRLKWACHRSNREIAQSCKIARSSVGECLTRAAAAGLTWPLPPDLDDGTLEARLYRRPGRPAGQRPLPEFTNDSLKKAAASTEFGGYAAGQRVTLTKVGDEIQVSYTNPTYYGSAYRLEDKADLQTAAAALEGALGKQQTFGTGDKQLSEADLQKYHYMVGIEYFDDPSNLAEYDSQEEALVAVEAGRSANKGGASKVYRIDIPGKNESVFGVALTDGCSGDEYIMSRVDKDEVRSTGHLPYEILVSDGNVYASKSATRRGSAVSWPRHLATAKASRPRPSTVPDPGTGSMQGITGGGPIKLQSAFANATLVPGTVIDQTAAGLALWPALSYKLP